MNRDRSATPTAGAAIAFASMIGDMISHYLGRFPDEKQHLKRLLDQVEGDHARLCDRSNFTGHLTASGLLLDKKAGSVLLIHHRILNLWIQPGGHLDSGEHPSNGALREFREETGLIEVGLHHWHKDCKIPLDIDTHHIPENRRKGESSHYHHDFLYLVTSKPKVNRALELALDEVTDHRWVSVEEITADIYEPRLERVAGKLARLGI